MRPIPRFIRFVCIAALFLSQLSFAQTKRNSLPRSRAETSSTVGRSTFNSSCAACHGLDGHGSDKAVNIATIARVRNFTDTQLANIISNGVSGTGMPAFRSLNQQQVRAVVSYVRLLQGKSESQNLRGDAKRGKEIFFGKGECASCHTVEGQGGFLGPDLTNHAASSSIDGIGEEIVRSPRVPARGYRTAVLTTLKGERFEGVIRNEDNFSIQLQSRDGAFHLFKREELQSVEYSGSFMPSNYQERLTDGERNDLVSYLFTISRKRGTTPAPKKDDFE